MHFLQHRPILLLPKRRRIHWTDDGSEYDERDYYDERQPERYGDPQPVIHFQPIWSLTTVPMRITSAQEYDQREYQPKHRQRPYQPGEAIA